MSRSHESLPEPHLFNVSATAKKPLLDFILSALRISGCSILYEPPPNEAPYRITFETPQGERMGIVAYAFLANQKFTRNRPDDEHRFQVKYGSKDGREHELWQDPYGLYTTLFFGINLKEGFFVGADPVLHSPTKFFISIEFKQEYVEDILEKGWYSWERDRRLGSAGPIEILVGGRIESFLRYVRLEREALGESQGHRQLLADRFSGITMPESMKVGEVLFKYPSPQRLHQLANEFQLSEEEVLDLIESAPRLKMAVRGWVAEEHLYRELVKVRDVTDCERIEIEGGADISLCFEGTPLIVECKNVLRKTLKNGMARMDFQKTRASKGDPCSRYYSPDDFDIVAACLNSVTEKWDFNYVVTHNLEPHKSCTGKLTNNVRIDDRWNHQPRPVLKEAVALKM